MKIILHNLNIRKINSSNDIYIVILKNTKNIDLDIISRIKNKNCYFKILGGINDIEYLDRYESRITYSLDEIKKIVYNFEIIEKELPKDKFEKILYIYNYLRKNVNYAPKWKHDKNIRSLRSIYTKYAVCSGYSMLLKELLERQNIKCKYIKYYNHIWNHILINKKYYEVDLTWDACVYQKCSSSNLHYFANNTDLHKQHHNYKSKNNFLNNNLLKDYKLYKCRFEREDKSVFYLTLLPFGYCSKYYLYEDKNKKIIVNSFDDMEIIVSKNDKEIISSYVNCFFTDNRILKYTKDGIAYLGYAIVKNNCFYRKKKTNKNESKLKIMYNKDSVVIYENDKKFLLTDNKIEEVQ